jgi:hypothetical protein
VQRRGGLVDDLASDDGFEHLGLRNLLSWHPERIAVEHDDVGELADLERSASFVLVKLIGCIDGRRSGVQLRVTSPGRRPAGRDTLVAHRARCGESHLL